MGFVRIIKNLLSLNIPTEHSLKEGMVPLEDAKCPYCNSNFEKPLSRKKTCPVCQHDIFVRTLPFKNDKERIRVAVTEQQAENIDIAWAKVNGTYDDMQKGIQKYESKKKSLNKLWGIEPSGSDIEWHLLLDELIEHAKNNQWGLYRNTILRMAEHLYKLKEFDQSLRKYLNVLYLDVNGPSNATWFNGKPNLNERAFNPLEPIAFIAPGIIKRIVLLKDKRVCIDNEELKILFLEESSQVYAALKTPITPEKALQTLVEKDVF
ncbi:hypothetical protein NSS64_01650 [Paenibacillus sp. FSL H8-0122]|uniref:hypothetical protein n=1 Tax=Paenibacillus sp. FSL H8-0122 TaxID=2954510 RepID=UPI0030F7F431